MTVAAWERGGRMGNHWMRMRSLGQTIPGIYYPARGTVLSIPVHVARSVGYTYVAVSMESLAQGISSFCTIDLLVLTKPDTSSTTLINTVCAS